MSSVLAVFGRSELNLGRRVDDSKDGEGVEMDGRFGGRGVMERIVRIRNILLLSCFKGLTYVDVIPLLFIKIIIKYYPLTGREEDIGRTVAEALTELKRRVFGRDSLDGYLYMYIRSIKPSLVGTLKMPYGRLWDSYIALPRRQTLLLLLSIPSSRMPTHDCKQSISQSVNQSVDQQ